jgi:hypothetical protein
VAPAGPPTPTIASVIPVGGNQATINFSSVIPAGKWTRVTHLASGTSTRLGFLPGDASGDSRSAPDDILRVIDHLNGCLMGSFSVYSCDFDRSGICSAADILSLIDMHNGTGFSVWLWEELPP